MAYSSDLELIIFSKLSERLNGVYLSQCFDCFALQEHRPLVVDKIIGLPIDPQLSILILFLIKSLTVGAYLTRNRE